MVAGQYEGLPGCGVGINRWCVITIWISQQLLQSGKPECVNLLCSLFCYSYGSKRTLSEAPDDSLFFGCC